MAKAKSAVRLENIKKNQSRKGYGCSTNLAYKQGTKRNTNLRSRKGRQREPRMEACELKTCQIHNENKYKPINRCRSLCNLMWKIARSSTRSGQIGWVRIVIIMATWLNQAEHERSKGTGRVLVWRAKSCVSRIWKIAAIPYHMILYQRIVI